MRNFVLVLIAVLGVSFFACKKKPVPVEPEVVEIVKPDTIPVKIEKPKPKPIVIDEGFNPKHKYCIVVDSYTVEDFAKDRARYFKKKGLKPGIFMTDQDGWYKLAVKSFEKLKDAKAALAKMKKDPDFAKAWIAVR